MQEIVPKDEVEVPKYQKKSASSISQAQRKAKHKHMYEECLYVSRNEFYTKGEYCTICGVVGEISLGIERTGNRFKRLTNMEIHGKYEHLKLIKIEGAIPKYIPVRSFD